ncbi:MAG: UDP-N-acetylglucosamine 1-carboxyvinyltransferase [Candidatus Zambryskibacteria bacterium RIFCSPHIGHO2_01_FULL_43_27]|uniref:UDP-N-acetylglucosamine 1-carboxyvinyltransferase n=1 Tax=Candidatus Zambryskibacteria bacterium RIFCSPLOWO2_01_FULL_43_17 TaxID=1802760 RepID=A0A1G2U208_9BACT|nr:MAG: UDP-N-acetylglucosamine 1-carboxyvinyltransferase [Candidatus Zambryskibacteria bacterium RIFCSPHIGHO2_01_FULL_43_27]OHA99708.1 MAG: UDP-N-acetylglucosamine 1-carboxyvinyltransferase [Candidatus Zambryskibacteria bacterium RIFCSPHIGHO2_12_FULL_43_12b]OHB03565.1 MAG: UDP-N-acetylglucosamine 1-carboxyvinyltransferase [Candidatus Zambryskibacteria bacterium RIFCSPLOWO2_01_FULL_43_17]
MGKVINTRESQVSGQQEKLGSFIKSLRERRGLTQSGFAKRLKTSQSAVARMEAGRQNFTAQELSRIGKALEHKIFALDETIDFRITGGRKLHGSITTNYSKNGAMGLMCAALLNKSKTILHGIPRIEEVSRMIEVFTSIGVSVSWIGEQSLEIKPSKKFDLTKINLSSAQKVRSIIMLIGPLIHQVKSFSIPHAGGCKMGNRTIEAHRHGLKALGAKIVTKSDRYEITSGKKRPAEIVMYEASDTATENIIMASALVPGKTLIEFAPPNYQVQEVCFFLESLGVKIDGIGTTTLVVHGISEIDKEIEYTNSEDPIESMLFISSAITTGSKLTIKRCPIDFLKLELLKLNKMGLRYDQSKEYFSKNGRTKLVDIIIYPSTLKEPSDKIHSLPYPGINSDNLPLFVPIATQAKGTTLIHDWMWENRAIYFTELNKLGAQVVLADQHRVFVQGPTKLKGAQVVCPPALRPAVIILIAMLAADGVSTLRNVYSISRGYEGIAERLNKIGAKIEVMKGA